ncbi:negative regulator of systemic acquired resistance SNI1 [Impatiens glandulifera]|uniref:negative regulator of systemic acquired resistance SNI1 n=1 Tax=Impatiens glandulifera TaxID=253017 RepID=UPI001FB124BF|nr:negative regulator of systemic acquired resistance SNI1 [Impatiens glandulifera]
METRNQTNTRLEENTMAILDSAGFKTDSRHTTDDRIAFLEAVRAASIVPEASISPTKKMCEAIFQILREESSLELLVESFQLLNQLDKRFPRVSMSRGDESNLKPPSNCDNQIELVVLEEAWSPFIFGSDNERADTSKNRHGPIDITGFHLLVEEIVMAGQTNSGISQIKALKDMMLLQYLISVLEGDFIPRNTVYQYTTNWSILRDSLLNTILGSRRVRYKDLVQDILSIMCDMSPVQSSHADGRLPVTSEAHLPENCDIASTVALPELRKCTGSSMQKLIVMIMELDKAKKNADVQGLTTRADGVRTPLVEIIQDHLAYNEAAVSPFFEVFTEPKCKLDIIVQYFQKYMAKPSVRTRRSNNLNPAGEATFPGILNCFCNGSITKNIRKKIHPEVIQLLLAHAFQAYLSLPAESFDGNHNSKEAYKNSVAETCKNFISAFTNLRRDGCMEILPFAKEALFTATCILSTK